MKIKVTAPSREELITYLEEVIGDLREGLINGSMGVPGEPPRYRWAQLVEDYGFDVDRFNAEHNHANGCRLGRVVGSDITECDTHNAYVAHGVPELLRDI